MPETRISDYASFLRDLGSSGADYFLEGGQAVNFWAEFYSAKGAADELSDFVPFTSKDCDVWASYAALQYLQAQKEGSRFVRGTSPADGQAGIVTLSGTPPKTVDIMTNVYGIAQNRMKQLKDRALVIDGIRVIDPILLFQSKCHCLLGLDQRDRQDEKHLRMLCLLVPEHLESLLFEATEERVTQRALINEVKLLQKILKTNRVKRAVSQTGVDPVSLIPVEKFANSRLTKIERFAKTFNGG